MSIVNEFCKFLDEGLCVQGYKRDGDPRVCITKHAPGASLSLYLDADEAVALIAALTDAVEAVAATEGETA